MRAHTIGAAVLACALTQTGCSEPAAAAAAPRPTPVKVQRLAAASGETTRRFSGALEPVMRVDLAFRVAGYVEGLGQTERRALDRGDRVAKGALLARLRSAEYQQKLDSARAQADEARAAARLAGEELQRAHRLFADGASSRADLDARHARAESARAQLAAAQARVDEAALALHDTELRAPLDAVVLSRNVEIGSLMTAGQPAFSLVDTRRVKAVFGAPQALLSELRLGSALQVSVQDDNAAPQRLEAKVSNIAPLADALGRVFRVEAELPNPGGRLRPGAVVSIEIPDGPSAAQPEVPLSAIVRSARDPRGFAVFVLEGEGARAPARLRDIELGDVLGNAVQVASGVSVGERVVSVGASLLRDGADVVVIR